MEVQTLFVLVIFLGFVNNGEAQLKTFLINCGTNSSITVDGDKWVGDIAPNNNVTLSPRGIEASIASVNGNSEYAPLYKTARIFSEPLRYMFQGAPGNYFIRLYFYPIVFQNYSANQSYFAVEANDLSLAVNFHVPSAIAQRNAHYSGGNYSLAALVKEFYVPIKNNSIVINFVPSEGSFGFVNAIEVVQVIHTVFDESVKEVSGNGGSVSLDFTNRGVETMYRLNVGGTWIKPDEDSGFRRMWVDDSRYMINVDAGSEARNKSRITYPTRNDTFIAPLQVYETARTMTNTLVLEKRFNMSWRLEVDPGFDYVIRLHFCELEFDKANQRIFKIYINNKTASINVDIFARVGGKNKAYHEDYFDPMPSQSNSLWVQLGPDISTGSQSSDALLNGLEIFKLSSNGNLAYIPGDGKGKRNTWLGIGAGVASIIVVAGLGWLTFFLYNKQKMKNIEPMKSSGARSGKRFSLADIRAATKNFDDSLVIGVGGFGNVYKGELSNGTLAAIKRSNPQSQQGLLEFETEIEMLSKLRHRHLVSIMGFCDEQNEMILVYEYMANGTLRSHLFGNDLPSLSWKQRLEICIGAARGLHYLHTGLESGIIHRDVKTTNILLDENFVAKMADFGLSKSGVSLEQTHVSTAVKGSFGYLDPEYFRKQQLTAKSDVYSFGVVLFEVVCARAVLDPRLPIDQINLAEWAVQCHQQGLLETIIDPTLKGSYCPESFKIFGEIAEKCLADEGKDRPTMGEILCQLEYALQLHESWSSSNDMDD